MEVSKDTSACESNEMGIRGKWGVKRTGWTTVISPSTAITFQFCGAAESIVAEFSVSGTAWLRETPSARGCGSGVDDGEGSFGGVESEG